MSAKNCLKHHMTDRVYTDEMTIGPLTVTQHRFVCRKCNKVQVAYYTKLRFRKEAKI